MIVALIGYGTLVGALGALAAWLVERAQIACHRPRKHAWIGGIVVALVVPGLVLWLREPGQGALSALAMAVHIPIQGAAEAMPLPAASPGGEANRGSLNAWLAALWALTSALLIGAYAFSAWRLGRRARSWGTSRIGEQPVSIAPDVGPAVFGWLRTRVVFPRWLVEAPAEVQLLALAHEREHVSARDPQVLSAATLLGALLPWNLPLHWMLRRLRFAMEVDCDARVIRRGADPNDYGLALLYVSERQSRAPITAIALIGRKSQLERRINFMFATPRKYPALVAAACLALAGSCLVAAAQIEAPSLQGAIHKPPPAQGLDSAGFRLGQRLEVLLREQYPELLREKFSGTPIVVALVNDDWSIARSAKTLTTEPIDAIQPKEQMFGILGVASADVPYVGAMQIKQSQESERFVLMVYTESKKPGKRFVSSLFPDTRATDRAIFKQAFPATRGIPAGQSPWVLLDRSGKVLRSGIEEIKPETWLGQFQQRYGVRTQEFTVTPLTDERGEPLLDLGGRELNLNTVWLADSPGN